MTEWSLVIFTVFMQLSIGCVVMAWFYQQVTCSDLSDRELPYIVRPPIMMAFFFGLFAIISAFFYLGSPLNVMYAMANFADSWLSRQFVLTALFILLLFISILFIFLRGYVSFGWVAATAIVGLVDLYAMSAVYDNSLFILWNGWQTYAAFYGSALLMGSVLSALFMLPKLEEYEVGNESLAMTLFNMTLVGLFLVSLATIVMFFIASPGMPLAMKFNSATFPSSTLLLTIVRYVLLILGMFMIGRVLVKPKSKKVKVNLLLALMFMMSGEIAGRYVFFMVGG